MNRRTQKQIYGNIVKIKLKPVSNFFLARVKFKINAHFHNISIGIDEKIISDTHAIYMELSVIWTIFTSKLFLDSYEIQRKLKKI